MVGPCPQHDAFEKRMAQGYDDLGKGQRAIKSTVDAMQIDVQELKNGLWGPNMSNGLTGKVHGLSGSFKIIIAMLGMMVLITGWNARQSSKYMAKLQEHNEAPAHAIMGERYIALDKKIDTLISETAILHNSLDGHIMSVIRQHPEKVVIPIGE